MWKITLCYFEEGAKEHFFTTDVHMMCGDTVYFNSWREAEENAYEFRRKMHYGKYHGKWCIPIPRIMEVPSENVS